MTLQDASLYFKNLITTQTKEREQKIYKQFIKLIFALEQHGLSDTEVLRIEQQLDALQLTTSLKNKKRFFNLKLQKFKSYLRNQHGLVNKDHYSNTGLAMGMSFGMLAGLIFGESLGFDNGLIVGMVFGMTLGIIIGKNKDAEAARQNRVLKTT